jgi:hypothetical protein
MKNFNELAAEEQYITEAITAARKIQEFLWGELNAKWDIEEYKRMLRKRMAKIDDIDIANPHALVELRKRVLQNTAIGVALLLKIDTKQFDGLPPSNLPQYAK